MIPLQVATNGLLSFTLLGVASDGYLGVPVVVTDYINFSNKRASKKQLKQSALEALKKELWYLYQDENEVEVKEALRPVINDDFSEIEALIALLQQRIARQKEITEKASREEYRDALLAAQRIKTIVRQKNEDKIFVLLF